jgi:pimeloyl-ACP methyl ester carboxylesterase
MSTVHCWFRSGAYSLLGHIDCPQTSYGSLGVVIVPAFGWEDVCSYRPLRFLGQTFAANGIPALRFDLPGTGDSSGDARDSGLFDAWIRSIGDAAAELRAATRVQDIAVVGINLGAMLALMAAARGSHLQDLVLWGPAASGRAALRELRAFANMARSEYANDEPSPPQPIPGLEVAGFLIAPETQRALETLDLSSLPGMEGRRVLVLSRDDLRTDTKLVRLLKSSGCSVELKTGTGYAAMMAQPEEALPPAATGCAIVEFLTEKSQLKRECKARAVAAKTALTQRHTAKPATTFIEVGGPGVFETTYAVKCSSSSMFGILSEPNPKVPPTDCCLLFLNAGAVRHTGPNRMWVEAARRWAARGVVSLRLDLLGIGESDGEANLDTASLYHDRMVEKIETTMDSLRSRLGIRHFAAIGLCSGAFWAFHATVRNPDIRAAVLLNPRLFFWDPEVECHRVLWRAARFLTDAGDWRRLARGEVPLKSIKRVAGTVLDSVRQTRTAAKRSFQIEPEAMAQAWAALERNQSRLTFIFTEGEPLLREMKNEGHLPSGTNSRVRCVRIANSGHTFRPLWAQKAAHEVIDSELENVVHDCRLDSLKILADASRLG